MPWSFAFQVLPVAVCVVRPQQFLLVEPGLSPHMMSFRHLAWVAAQLVETPSCPGHWLALVPPDVAGGEPRYATCLVRATSLV